MGFVGVDACSVENVVFGLGFMKYGYREPNQIGANKSSRAKFKPIGGSSPWLGDGVVYKEK